MKPKQTIKKKEKECYDFCPQGKNPTYCDLCKEVRNQDWQREKQNSRLAHGLKY